MLWKTSFGFIWDILNVSTPKVGVLNVKFALKLRIYRSLKSLTVSNESARSFPQNCILSFNTLHSRSLPLKIRQQLLKLDCVVCIVYAVIVKIPGKSYKQKIQTVFAGLNVATPWLERTIKIRVVVYEGGMGWLSLLNIFEKCEVLLIVN